MTLFVTHLSAATGGCVWMLIDWWIEKKPTMHGIATGASAGLAAITPASGVTIVYTGVVSFLILAVVKVLCGGLSVTQEEERLGLDQSAHGENAYND